MIISKNKFLIAGFVAVGSMLSTAHADTFQLIGEGFAQDFGSSFAGSDSFPFTGLEQNDPVSFQFEYDDQTAAHTIEGNRARYTFTGTNSFFVIGDNTMSVDTFELIVGTTNSGFGLISMSGRNETHGISAGIQFESTQITLPMDVPTSLDTSMFNSLRMFSVNSDQNQLLLPNLFGPIQAASIVPAPGTISMVIGASVLGMRRRGA